MNWLSLVLPAWARALIIPALLVGAGYVGFLLAYGRGYDAAEAEAERARALALAAAMGRVAALNAEIAEIREHAAGKEQETETRGRTVVRTVERIVREEPDYASLRRPDRLHAERLRQLEAIDRAAAERELR